MKAIETIAVLGAGSWGTAIAILLSKNGCSVRLWGRNADKMRQLQSQRQNSFFLPGIRFPDKLDVTSDMTEALAEVDLVVVAVPSHAFRQTLAAIREQFIPQKLVWITKGLEPQTHQLLHQIVAADLPQTSYYGVVSGPTFAMEVAKGLPTAVSIASSNRGFTCQLVEIFHNQTFRPYICDDMIGLEVGGAVKNVLAIAAGIADGLGFGANTRAALITRGAAEMGRLATKLGAHKETIMGLSGIGDLLLTCTDNQSRNRRMGLALGRGQTLAQARAEIQQVVEGIQTAKEIYTLAKRLQIDMPIVEQVYGILYQNVSAREAVSNLLERDYKHEQIDAS